MQVATGAAASLEKTKADTLRCEPGYNRFQNLAARAEPPVFAFDLVEAVIDVSFHDLV